MNAKSILLRLLYMARDLRSGPLFTALKRYCRGRVLDVGGWDFYLTAKRRGTRFDSWTTLEYSPDHVLDLEDVNFEVVYGDGCDMEFEDESFDTVLNVQVLEHVFEPIRMMDEVGRVLRPGGHAILLLPQTSTTHMAPSYFYNFSRYWIQQATTRAGLEIVDHRPLGGVWSSMASHLVFFFLQSFRVRGMSGPEYKRNLWFYLLFPLMAVFAVVAFPICMLLSLGDLTEEPNNHLVVARKMIVDE